MDNMVTKTCTTCMQISWFKPVFPNQFHRTYRDNRNMMSGAWLEPKRFTGNASNSSIFNIFETNFQLWFVDDSLTSHNSSIASLIVFRYPPNKRPNYQKLGIEEPFGCSWQNTVDQWSRVVLDVIKSLDEIPGMMEPKKSSNSEEDTQTNSTPNASFAKASVVEKGDIGDFYILRDRQLLWTIKDLCLDYKLHGSKKTSTASVNVSEKRHELLTFLIENHSKAIIPISFLCVRRGEITDNALISIPLAEDIKNLNSDVEYGGPLEPAHRGLKASFPAIADTVKINRNHVKNIGLCTRWTIGRVTSGRYSLSCGKSAGIGFVSIAGLVLLFLMQNSDEDRSLMLVRNMSSKQYRFARMDLIMS